MRDNEENSVSTTIKPSAIRKPPRSWTAWLIGRPLPNAAAPHETIGKLVGLAVFASDALSSTAYATQEMLVILAAAGTAAFGYAFPISIAIVILMGFVVTSYEQTIHAYPGGGGAYIVARDNLGDVPAQAAGAALLVDYTLTVSVSISSGVAQIVSAIPFLFEYRVLLALLLVGLVMMVNLRGVRESGIAFAIPAYIFLFLTLLMVFVGLVRFVFGGLGTVPNPPPIEAAEAAVLAITPFLLLHAFSTGTSAMTGIEAIANGITAFKEPRTKNAGIVLIWMAAILAVMFLGISFLAGHTQAVPSEQETVISQITRTIYGGQNILYLVTVAMTSIILVMAANTAFAGFPRLAAILAQDGFVPRQFAYRGSRLVFSKGIFALALAAGVIIIIFNASVTRMISLYAIGVFLSFTLSQLGMAVRWYRSGRLSEGAEYVELHTTIRHDPKWLLKLVTNGIGTMLTAVVTLVFAYTKFADGAWIVIVVIPIAIIVFTAIHRHYKGLARKLSLDEYTSRPRIAHQRVILTISGVHRGTLEGLRFARSLSDDITAVYVSLDEKEAERVADKWEIYGDGMRLVVLNSPYRLLVEPLLEYIRTLASMRQPNEVITVVVPQFVSRSWWSGLLHSQTAFLLRFGLLLQPGVVIIEVPYQVD